GVPVIVAPDAPSPWTARPGGSPSTLQVTAPVAPRVASAARYGSLSRAGARRLDRISKRPSLPMAMDVWSCADPALSVSSIVKGNGPRRLGVPLRRAVVPSPGTMVTPGGRKPETTRQVTVPCTDDAPRNAAS